ncbi:hypothetical protein K402DRAFT_449984 [Aulographum hederae CBS 113979]|uniref:Uncharacterized protein n=1 Tax=Aulographum hederae CBS 113979 TaxID=1176131 RepID=A0A6G1HFT2_9PEZI|nr:hypothetical protein K402DRAFT_449984 [Aulographum hederae CBS 113979]
MQSNGFRRPPSNGPRPTMNGNSSYYDNGFASPSSYNTQPSPPLDNGGPRDATPQNMMYANGANAAQTPPASALLGAFKAPYGNARLSVGATSRNGQRSSARLDATDPVALHLLVETALGDSQEFEVLSYEEVEGLKKEREMLAVQVKSVRQKLAFESKVRDGAMNLNRLYKLGSSSNTSPKQSGGRRSITGSRDRDSVGRPGSSKGDAAQKKSEDELANATKKCDEYSTQLYKLELRAQEVQRELLMHTAGILQMTHKGPTKKKNPDDMSELANGTTVRPDSPASIYTYEDTLRPERGFDATDFDERSLYKLPDSLAIIDLGRKTEADKSKVELDKQNRAIMSIGQRLEELNGRMREVIVQANPERNRGYSTAPRALLDGLDGQAISSLNQQLNYLDQGLNDIGTEQDSMQRRVLEGRDALNENQRLQSVMADNERLQAELEANSRLSEEAKERLQADLEDNKRSLEQAQEARGQVAAEENQRLERMVQDVEELQATLDGYRESQKNTEDQLAELNKHIYSQVKELDPNFAAPSEDDTSSTSLLDYLASSVMVLKKNQKALKDQADQTRSRSQEAQNAAEQYSVVLEGLWQIILAGEEDARLRRIQNRSKDGARSEQDQEDDRPFDATTPFELPLFSTKVQWLVTQGTDLREQLNRVNGQYAAAKEELLDQIEGVKKEASLTVDRASRDLIDREAEREQREQQLLADLKARQDQVENLESYIAGAVQEEREARKKAELALEARLQTTAKELDEAKAQSENAAYRSMELESILQKKKVEYDELEGEVVRLTTEVTLAKAELDGAYGSRAQRKAEWNSASQSKLEDAERKNRDLVNEIEALRAIQADTKQISQNGGAREDQLKKELQGLVEELREVTLQGVEAEREREELESAIDGLRERVERLQEELGDERVRWLGVKSPGLQPGGETEMTSIGAMRGEFKRMMREARQEGTKALRAEQDERRKLEQQVRALKRDQTPGKSGLSQSMTLS